jgi:RNA polymerase sigma-70 factor (ECF subfamily)
MQKVVSLKPRLPGASVTLDTCSDDELMLLVRGGEKAALAVLATRHLARLTSFCARQLSDRAAADDLAQDVWVRLWASRVSYEPQGKFVVLLYTIARNLCRNHARSSRRRGRWLGSPPLDFTTDHAPSEALTALLERERLRDAQHSLARLSEAMREAILLRFHEGLSYEDIAAVVGAPESTVRSRVFHGLKEMRAQLMRKEGR